MPYHKCTDQEYEEFYPVKKKSAGLLKSIKQDPDRGMFCIDWNDDDPIELTGDFEEEDYTRFDIILTPCNYLHTMHGYQGDFVSPECIRD